MQDKIIKFRPLSDGVGLGHLQSPMMEKSKKSGFYGTPVTGQLDKKLPDINQVMMKQAHAAYAPASVATELRQRAQFKLQGKIIRFLTSLGTDIAVAVISLFVLSWAGVIAWNLGAGVPMGGMEAAKMVLAFMIGATIPQIVGATITSSLVLRVFRRFFT